MNMREFFTIVGGSHAEAIARFTDDEITKIFAKKYLKDTSYDELAQAVKKQDMKTAFEAAHTLKGVSGNMCFGRLYEASVALTEQLRADKTKVDPVLYQTVSIEQKVVLAAISVLD